MLASYKKRMDFDYILCQTKLDEIVQEIQPKRFQKLKDDILQLVSVLDASTKKEYQEIFDNPEQWSIMHYRDKYTGGLHSNERAATIDSYMRMTHKLESTIFEMLEHCRRMQSKDMSLECNSKEAHSYFTHPVYSQMRK